MALLEKFWTVIKPLRSSVKGRIPTTAAVGELAVNDTDEILYLKKEDGSFVEWESKKEYNIFSYDYTIPEQGQVVGDDIWYKVGNIYGGTLSRGVFNVRFIRSEPTPNGLYEKYSTITIEVLGTGLRLLQSHKIEGLNFRWRVTNVPNSAGISKNRELYLNVSGGSAVVSVYLKQVSGAIFVAETSTTPVSLADIPGSYPPDILNENYIPGVGIEMIKNEDGKIVVNSTLDGPSSSTDNAIARFDGTTGKFLQDSGVYIDDSGNLVMSKTSSIISTDTTDGADNKKMQIAGGGGVGTNRGGHIELCGNESTGAEGEVRILAGNSSVGTIRFYTGAYVEKMRIAKEGNVGISTNNPSEKLHVIGNILASQDSASRTKTIANKVRMEYNTSTDTLEFNFI